MTTRTRRTRGELDREIADALATEPRQASLQDRIDALGRSVMASQHHGRDATNATAPWHIWQSSALEIAGVSQAEKDHYARVHLQRAYDAGEPAWMAADMVRQRVRGGLLADREQGEISALRRAAAGLAGAPDREPSRRPRKNRPGS